MLTGQADHVLPARRPVPAALVVRGGLPEHDAGRRQAFRQSAGGRLLDPVDLYVAEMRLASASSYRLWIRIAGHSFVRLGRRLVLALADANTGSARQANTGGKIDQAHALLDRSRAR